MCNRHCVEKVTNTAYKNTLLYLDVIVNREKINKIRPGVFFKL